uniref:Uncharacterized protein n=1 Tax=Stomoxys calcitrans TaxID=35570 RepID=A0A1I8PDM8_STOCA
MLCTKTKFFPELEHFICHLQPPLLHPIGVLNKLVFWEFPSFVRKEAAAAVEAEEVIKVALKIKVAAVIREVPKRVKTKKQEAVAAEAAKKVARSSTTRINTYLYPFISIHLISLMTLSLVFHV